MATRNQKIVAAPQRRADPPPAGKRKAGVTKAGKGGDNRRVLGDIGNRVKVQVAAGKLEQEVNRPITRNFGAQLRAVGLTAAVVNKTTVAVPKPAARRADKNVCVKPDPENVIEISSDSDRTVMPMSASSVKKPSRKNIYTLTSVLAARSKVACGISSSSDRPVPDIDALDIDNQLAVTEYVEDIYKFYKMAERSSTILNYMDSQLEINEKMRATLADWIIEVHQKFELMPETLYLTIHIIDRYLSLETVKRKELQLVGMSSMLIACKYEEIWAPEVNDFICISDGVYTRAEVLAMEKTILNRLLWSLTLPTPYVFLVRFLKAAAGDEEMEHMVFFFAELSLMQYPVTAFRPSTVAASAVYAARCTLQKHPLWTESLMLHTGLSEQELTDCARMLVKSHSAASGNKLKVVYKKYSSKQFGSVALLPPAARLLDEPRTAKS